MPLALGAGVFDGALAGVRVEGIFALAGVVAGGGAAGVGGLGWGWEGYCENEPGEHFF